jgi:ADP-ribose pyrophosphatase YjhB (NUDIX family)
MAKTGSGAHRDPRIDPLHCPQCGGSRLVRRVPRRDDRERPTCTECGYVHYVGPALAAGAILRDGDALCLVRRGLSPGKGLWTFPGGFVDLEEEPEFAALRETEEETGCRVELGGIVGAYGSEGPRGKQVVIIVYEARLLERGESCCGEVEEVRWFACGDLPWGRFAFPATERALRDWLSRCADADAPGSSPPASG